MAIFKGQLWLATDRVGEVSVEIFLNEERIKLMSNGTEIGDWPLSEVKMELKDHDVHLFVEDEEMVIWSSDPGFTPAMVGEEAAENFEPYVPWDSPEAQEYVRRRKRRKLWRRVLGR